MGGINHVGWQRVWLEGVRTIMFLYLTIHDSRSLTRNDILDGRLRSHGETLLLRNLKMREFLYHEV